jgi:hypothetical protein
MQVHCRTGQMTANWFALVISFGFDGHESWRDDMANYIALTEAVRVAKKETALLREVMKTRAQAASTPPKMGAGLSKGTRAGATGKK